jgi:hypothetical protein
VLPVSRLKHFKTVKDFVTKALPLGAAGGAAAGATGYLPEGTESLVGEGEMTRGEMAGIGSVAGVVGTPVAVGVAKGVKKVYEPIGETAWNILKQPAGAGGTIGGLIGFNVDRDATTEDKWRNAIMGAAIGAGGASMPKLLDSAGVTNDLTGKFGDLIIGEKYKMASDFITAMNKLRGSRGVYAKDWDTLVQGIREMPVEDRKILYRMLDNKKFGLDSGDFDLDKLGIASESREKIKEYGEALVNLGVLDERTFVKYMDYYINNSYMKYETGYNEIFNNSDDMLYGMHHIIRMRGKISDPSKFSKAQWEKGQTPDGTDRELWEVIEGDGKFRVRRQWFKEEKLAMGEIEDAAYAMHKTGRMLSNERSLGEFFNDLANSAEVVKPDGFAGGVKVPKGFGNLTGKTVDQRTWNNLKKFREFQKEGTAQWLFDKYKTANGVWKGFHTIMNPAVHFANVVSSGHMFDLANGDWADVGRAARDMYQDNDMYKQMVEDGVFGAGIMTELNEGQREVLKAYSTSGSAYIKMIGDSPNGLARAMDWTTKMAKLIKKVGWDIPGQVYQFEDNIWRAALYRTKLNLYLDNGMPMAKARGMAARDAKEYFVDYDNNPPVLNALRQTALPFFSYTYGTLPKLAEVAAKNPAKYAKWAMIYYGLNALGENMSDTPRRRQERINELQEKNPLFGVPGLPNARVDMPDVIADRVHPGSRDQQSLNIERWLPGGKFSMTEGGTGQIPFLPEMLQPSGGVAGAVGWPLIGVNQFQGTEVPEGQRTQEILRNLFPNWQGIKFGNFDTYAEQKVRRADSGKKSQFGDDYSPLTARLSNAGIRIEPQNIGKMESRIEWKYEERIANIDKQIRKAKRETKYTKEERERVLESLYAKRRKEQDAMKRRLMSTRR